MNIKSDTFILSNTIRRKNSAWSYDYFKDNDWFDRKITKIVTIDDVKRLQKLLIYWYRRTKTQESVQKIAGNIGDDYLKGYFKQ
jgi:hypothetical protein